MRNMHPADELAMIRADLRRLKEREAYLRDGFLSMRLPNQGDEAVATVKIFKHRRFCRDRLPAHVLDNADYWDTQIVRDVHVDAASKLAGRRRAYVVDDDSFDVIEHF